MAVLKWLDKNFEICCMALLLVVMTVLSFANVVMRYCFNNALSWSDEVCCYCLALSAFFSLPATIRNRSMIRVDTFTTMLSKPVQKTITIVCTVIVVLFSGLLFKGGLDLIAVTMKTGQRSPALQIPVAYLYWVMTLCFIWSVFRGIQVVFLDVAGKESES